MLSFKNLYSLRSDLFYIWMHLLAKLKCHSKVPCIVREENVMEKFVCGPCTSQGLHGIPSLHSLQGTFSKAMVMSRVIRDHQWPWKSHGASAGLPGRLLQRLEDTLVLKLTLPTEELQLSTRLYQGVMLEGDPDIWLTPALSYQVHLACPEILAQVSQFCEENNGKFFLSSFISSPLDL